MPWQHLRDLSAEDLAAMYTSLQQVWVGVSTHNISQITNDSFIRDASTYCAATGDCDAGETCGLDNTSTSYHECIGRGCNVDADCRVCQVCSGAGGTCGAFTVTSTCKSLRGLSETDDCSPRASRSSGAPSPRRAPTKENRARAVASEQMLAENRMLVHLIERFQPERLVSVHQHHLGSRRGDSPGVFVDPRRPHDLMSADDAFDSSNQALSPEGEGPDPWPLRIAPGSSPTTWRRPWRGCRDRTL